MALVDEIDLPDRVTRPKVLVLRDIVGFGLRLSTCMDFHCQLLVATSQSISKFWDAQREGSKILLKI